MTSDTGSTSLIMVCPSCASRYRIPKSVINRGSRQVRCAKCSHSWVAGKDNVYQGDDQSQRRSDDLGGASDNDPGEGGDVKNNPETPDIGIGNAGFGDVGEQSKDDHGAHIDPDGEAFSESEEIGEISEGPPPMMGAAAAFAAAQNEAERNIMQSIAESSFEAEQEYSNTSVTGRMTDVLRNNRLRILMSRLVVGAAASLVIVGLLGAALYAARNEVVEIYPRAGVLFSALGIPAGKTQVELDSVAYRMVLANGEPSIFVLGNVVNVSQDSIEPPLLSFEIIDDADNTLTEWNWRMVGSNIPPGATSRFRSRFVALPETAHTINIHVRPITDAHAYNLSLLE